MDDFNFLQSSSSIAEQNVILLNYEIVFWLMISMNLIFIAIARTTSKNYIKVLFTTAFVNRYLVQNVQDEMKATSAASILLTLTYFSSLALLVAYMVEGEYTSLAPLFFGIFIGLAVIKRVIIYSVSHLTQTNIGTLEHTYNHLVFYQVGGLILTPVLFLTHFFSSEYQYYISILLFFIVLLLIIAREFQSLLRALKSRVPLLYIILYLCTLELMPLVLFIYAFVNNFNGLT